MKKNMFYIASLLMLGLLAGCSATTSSKSDEINLNRSLNWLTINKHREGVQQTASGLQYKILKEASGCQPSRSTTVTVNYDMRVATTNEVVDQNYQRHSPAKLPLSKVIKGWQEGVALMRVGEIWEFYIPPELAYGEKSSGPSIRPNTALTSKIWLLGAKHCQK
ncbi:FKBP-type peptidyl-prolyl cis-trans isomerase [Pseudocolwellia sp. AS88]|uniref:FKBP-type peptidyl-prolyl cis-trans isomerase n=1 Tax=Pseudocolwellia sp. AS88 TaxID=3063958 RepID=UPI0026EA55F9|nr:FKBP-type peptidyl-prolyl cis-trans isomerase [Pseudocolwellia sp. AS88]MDO7083843.1 FKBP-type peptidyl-prolyl cis-trans isomerase [Pseudocolwellia sp. AS88]